MVIILGFLLIQNFIIKASVSKLFSYDENAVNMQLSELSSIENSISNGADFSSITNQLIAIKGFSENAQAADKAFGIPSFLWGCCAGVPGIILVQVVTNNYDESKKAFTGLVVRIAAIVVAYVIDILVIGTSFSYTY